MARLTASSRLAAVAPLAGSVDRNHFPALPVIEVTVAPLAGSVDRNAWWAGARGRMAVAPLAGSVDRNDANDKNRVHLVRRSPRGERG